MLVIAEISYRVDISSLSKVKGNFIMFFDVKIVNMTFFQVSIG